ncbi:MAG: ABC transporter ATP-binding protein [Deltaproteobacteria bacterium]|nr:MAG: ABC transporter ATP-binding protein [Deltaproteobacteria bacterium]
MSEWALELRGIDKRYGAVVANRGVTLAVRAGTVHAVVGENGAGKTTAMRIAYGLERADGGELAIRGRPVDIRRHSPAGAIARGLGMVHQHFMLVGPMTVAENVALGREPRRGPWLDRRAAERHVADLARRYGLRVDPTARVDQLSVGEQQRVEILKVLSRGCDVVILDEPTAVLAPPEVDELFAVVRGLVAAGATVVIITHKLDEVVDLADRVTVMRRGEVVAELEGALDPDAIARAMVGRPVTLAVPRAAARPGDVALDVRDLYVAGRGADAVHGVTLQVRAGEIVAIAGVVGNGQTELVEAIAGLRPVRAGSVAIAGVDVTRAPVRARHAAGLAHVPEDRHARGLVLALPVADNAILGRERECAGRFGLDRGRQRAIARGIIDRFDVRPPRVDVPAAALSGGNQQKLVVGRELTRSGLRVLLIAQPTRGVDIGASELLYREIAAARDAGAGVLLASADLAEVRALADRAVVMVRGRIAASVDAEQLAADDAVDRLGRAMTGAAP